MTTSSPLDVRFLLRWVDRMRGAFGAPAVGVLLHGSHARGTATPVSDVNLDVLVTGLARPAYPAFLADQGDRLVHVSVAVRDVTAWLNRTRAPATWSFGLPVAAPVRLLWAADEWRARLDLRELRQPPGRPELENLIAGMGKLVAACTAGDDDGARLAAADLARLSPSVLRLANPPVTVASRRQALGAALAMPNAPTGYADDLRRCLGLRAGPLTELRTAAHRLVTGVVDVVRPYADELLPVCGPDLVAALTDGRLDRYLRQLAG